jgi:hypothetical protein
MLSEIGSVVWVFALLCTSAALGMYVRPLMPSIGRGRETEELMQLTVGVLATFAALVLSLLTATIKQQYATAAHDRDAYALQLTQLHRCLREYGPDTAAARSGLASYVAAVIASTWPSEPPPTGVSYPSVVGMPRTGASPELAGAMTKIGGEITRLTPATPAQERLLSLCLSEYRDVLQARLSVVEDAQSQIFRPFFRVLEFWLMIMFGCFGLLTPRHPLPVMTIGLCALSLSTVVFVILDLSQPYGGYFSIPSTAMRTALAGMLQD